MAGTLVPLMQIGSSVDKSPEKVLNRVAVDLVGWMCRFLEWNQSVGILIKVVINVMADFVNVLSSTKNSGVVRVCNNSAVLGDRHAGHIKVE